MARRRFLLNLLSLILVRSGVPTYISKSAAAALMVNTNRSRRRLVLLMLLPITFLSWSFVDDFFQITKQIDIFSNVYREVNRYYVDEVNPGDLMKTGIDGMLKTLDPYTNYYPESEIEDYRMKHVSTEYGGIGASSFRTGDSIVIYNIYEGYPAQQSDIQTLCKYKNINQVTIKPVLKPP